MDALARTWVSLLTDGAPEIVTRLDLQENKGDRSWDDRKQENAAQRDHEQHGFAPRKLNPIPKMTKPIGAV